MENLNNLEHDDLLEAILKTAEFDREVSTSVDKGNKLTFKRDENGVLWSYDAKTGERIGRIIEHGND